MSSSNTKLAWMPVTKDTKPDDGLGNAVTSYKEKYSSMKLQLKNLLYENELYNAELIMLKRELIDIYSDKDTLLRRIVESGVDLGTSDDNDSDSQISDSLIPARCNDNTTATATTMINSDSTSKITALSIPSIATTTTTATTIATQAQVMTTTNTSMPCHNIATDNRSKPKAAPSKPRARPKPAANKAANAKTAPTDNLNQPLATAISNDQTNKTTKVATNAGGGPKAPAAKRKKQEPQQKAQQTEQKVLPANEQPAKTQQKPPAPKRQRKPAQKKPPQQKKGPEFQPQQQPLQQQQQQQVQVQQHQQQQQQQLQQNQQQPMTVIGQVQVSLPNDQMKYIQHVNLPEQNLAGTNNLIVTNHNANTIQIHSNHDNNNQQHHQIHFQLPQTTISTMESFQTPQSIITTSQGAQLGYGQHQSYTIVATNSNGNLVHHDLNQHHTSSPPVQITQLLPMNQTIAQHLSNQTIQNQGMTQQELNTIGFQQLQTHSNEQQQQQQQQQQQHQQHQETNYEHQIVHFELPQIQMPQQQTHIQHNHRIHIQSQQVQQTQRLQQSQSDPIASDDLEQHLDSRRLEQAPLIMPDWESNQIVPSELFGSESAIKFMAED